jgi:hypothetical protein
MLNTYNILDEEYNELVDLEQMLINAKNEAHRHNISSDLDEGYKSGNSCFSDSLNSSSLIKKVKKIESKITSVTIDLINNDERKLKCFKKINK